jgi:hypothetical protein
VHNVVHMLKRGVITGVEVGTRSGSARIIFENDESTLIEIRVLFNAFEDEGTVIGQEIEYEENDSGDMTWFDIIKKG